MFNAANNSKASFQYINANGLLLTTNSDNISGVLKGLQVNPTMVAAANNDVLVGLDITPTFTNGSYTGVSNYAIRSAGNIAFTNGANRYITMQAPASSGSSNHIVIQAAAANTSGTGGNIYLYEGNGAGGPGPGSIYIGANNGWTTAYVTGRLTVTNSGPNTDTAFQVNAGGQNGLSIYWDNVTPYMGYGLVSGRQSRFYNSSSYSFDNNLLIGTTTDAGYKLDVNGTQRIQFGSAEVGLQMTHTNGNTASIVIGNGSSASTGYVEFWRNGEYVVQYTSSFVAFRYANLRARNNTTLTLTGGIGYGTTIGTSIRLSPNTSDGGAYTATSGTQSTIITGNGSNEIWQPSSGNATYNLLTLSPVINTSGTYAGTVRGLYINPTLTSVTGTSYNAIEATGGNVVFGSSSTPSQLFVNGGYGGTTPLDIYLANFYGTSTINTGYGTGTKQWLLIGRGSIPTTSGIAGINLGNNQYESGLLFATASGGVFSEKMRIWNSGNVTINSTTDAGYKLDVYGTLRIYSGNGSIIEGGGSFTATGFCNFNGAAQSVAGTNCGLLNVQSSLSVGYQGAADASAIMQANSTTKGFLPPRMTATQRGAISTPAVGLVVYQTDGVEGLYVNTSGGWKALTMV